MKRFFPVCLFIMMTSLALSAQEHSPSPSPSTSTPTDAWATFTSEPGRFSVLLPEIPTDKTDTTQSEHGPYTTHLFVVRTERSVFLIGWVDYDPSFNFNIQSELDANRDNFVNGLKSQGQSINVVSTTKITMNGNPGIEFIAETPDTVYKSRVYIIDRRPYQLIAGSSKTQDDTVNVAKFFQSFKMRTR